MAMFDLLIGLFYVLAVIAMVHAVRRDRPRGDGAAGGAALLGFGILTVLTVLVLTREGVVQFWINHRANWAGLQVWFDLLAATAIAFYLLAPRARAVGLRVGLWAVAVALSASIALLPMLAIVLRREAAARPTGDGRGNV